jgi:hypothetical protein
MEDDLWNYGDPPVVVIQHLSLYCDADFQQPEDQNITIV